MSSLNNRKLNYQHKTCKKFYKYKKFMFHDNKNTDKHTKTAHHSTENKQTL